MMKFNSAVSILILAAMCGCGKEEPKPESENELAALVERRKGELVASADEKAAGGARKRKESSRDVVLEILALKSIERGFDAKRWRISAVETRGFSLKGAERDDEFELTETYDFPDDANDDFETRRFKAMWKAYADGLASIVTGFGASIDHEKAEGEHGAGTSEVLKTMSSCPLNGILTITSAESLDNGEYEVTVAVGWSKKREKMYSSSLRGEKSGQGKYALDEWVENCCTTGIICPQSYCDNEGVWWRVAGVPVDLGAGRNSKKVTWLAEKARHYAYEAAMRTIAVQVSARTSMSISFDSRDDDKKKEKIERAVKVEPMCVIRSDDPFRVKWLELDRVNSITGKPIRVSVCAIRDDADARDAERKFEPTA